MGDKDDAHAAKAAFLLERISRGDGAVCARGGVRTGTGMGKAYGMTGVARAFARSVVVCTPSGQAWYHSLRLSTPCGVLVSFPVGAPRPLRPCLPAQSLDGSFFVDVLPGALSRASPTAVLAVAVWSDAARALCHGPTTTPQGRQVCAWLTRLRLRERGRCRSVCGNLSWSDIGLKNWCKDAKEAYQDASCR